MSYALRIEDILSASGSKERVAELARHESVTNIFQDKVVPRDPEWNQRQNYIRQVFQDSAENSLAVARLLVAASSSRLAIVSDIDGTGAAICSSPVDSVLAPEYMESAQRLRDAGNSFTFITGRGEEDALNILGGVNVPVVCNFGTLALFAERREEVPLTSSQKAFIGGLHAFADTIPSSVIAQRKPSGLDIKGTIASEVDDVTGYLESLCAGRQDFSVHRELPTETSVRIDSAEKSRAIRTFVLDRQEESALFVFLGDSFSKAGGDRRAAEYVQRDLGGVSIQVLNDRPGCLPEQGGFQPDIVLPNPVSAAALLKILSIRK